MVRNKLVALLMSAAFATPVSYGQGFPSLPGLPRLPDKLPDLFGGSGQKPPQDSPTSGAGAKTAIGGICLLTGAAGAKLGQMLAERDAKRLNLNAAQKKSREQSYMLGWALAGCAIGGSAAANVITKMSAESKKAQEEAWAKAQQQTGPVAWQGPDAKGTTEIVEREAMPDGRECGTRRDVIEAAEGRAEPMMRVCRVAGGTTWEPQTALS